LSLRSHTLSFWLSSPMWLMLVLLGFVPIIWPVFSQYEGIYYPVLENVRVDIVERTPNGMIIDVRFDKVRQCDFVGISWYDTFGDRLPVMFEINGESFSPETRPVLDNQNVGPWKLIGIDNLDGSIAITSHRCHPLWITFTRFFP